MRDHFYNESFIIIKVERKCYFFRFFFRPSLLCLGFLSLSFSIALPFVFVLFSSFLQEYYFTAKAEVISGHHRKKSDFRLEVLLPAGALPRDAWENSFCEPLNGKLSFFMYKLVNKFLIINWIITLWDVTSKLRQSSILLTIVASNWWWQTFEFNTSRCETRKNLILFIM